MRRLIGLLIGFILWNGAFLEAQRSTPCRAATSRRSTVAKRDSHGRIARSPAARDAFKRQTGYPHGTPGYIIDHIVPLECGGLDAPSNMQWQTKAAAKIKDRTERNCRR